MRRCGRAQAQRSVAGRVGALAYELWCCGSECGTQLSSMLDLDRRGNQVDSSCTLRPGANARPLAPPETPHPPAG